LYCLAKTSDNGKSLKRLLELRIFKIIFSINSDAVNFSRLWTLTCLGRKQTCKVLQPELMVWGIYLHSFISVIFDWVKWTCCYDLIQDPSNGDNFGWANLWHRYAFSISQGIIFKLSSTPFCVCYAFIKMQNLWKI
jgi:hypothetical protein